MSTGGQGERLGGGYVDIGADLSSFDAAMDALPKKAASKMDAAMKALQARAAQVKLDLKVAMVEAVKTGNDAPVIRLVQQQDQLKAKIDAVTAAAVRQAQALQNAARASIASSKVPVGPKAGPAVFLDELGRKGKKAGEDIHQGGRHGAMGLLMLSQAVEDAQFGFQAIVNNIPGVVMGLGGSAGLAGAVSLIAVATNTWVKHWEDAKLAFGGDWSRSLGKKFEEVRNAILSAGAALVNFSSAVTLSGQDLAFNQRGLATRAEQKAALEKAREDAAGTVGGVRGRGEEERGQAFTEALKTFGGGDLLARELAAPIEAQAMVGVQNRAKLARDKNSPQYDPGFDLDLEIQTARKKVRDSVNLKIAGAMRGDEGQIEGLMGASPGLAKARENTAQQAIEVGGRENERAFAAKEREKAKKLKEDAAEFDMEASQIRAQENARLADALRGGRVGQGLLADAGMSDDALRGQVRGALGQSGMDANQIDAAVDGVVTKLRERVEKDVRARSLDRGIGVDQAREELAREAEKEATAEEIRAQGGRAEIMSDKAYLDKLLVAGFNQGDKGIPEKQLAATEMTNSKLDTITDIFKKPEERNSPVAVFARKVARR